MSQHEVGEEIYSLLRVLFPFCRSITGDGVRQTLKMLGEHIPLEVFEIPTGKRVFDWTVPREWNIREAFIEDASGWRVVDFNQSNLHVVSYSSPVRETLTLSELRKHLFTLPEHPDWIPYKTSYYEEAWGFCLSHNQLLSLKDGTYRVVIDSSLTEGYLSYGECFVEGESQNEVLVSTHICHPSLANDNLSSIGTAVNLAKHLSRGRRKFSYRFLFLPGTIGAITWLFLNQSSVFKIRHGLVLAGIGDAGVLTYKRSRRGDAEIDRVVEYVLKSRDPNSSVRDFSPYGYDERQYCSPGFNLPVGRLSRTPFGEYEQYHTSADNLSFVSPEKLGDSFAAIEEIFKTLEENETYTNLNPRCEPQLGRRGLYQEIGTQQLAMLWVLNLSDGEHPLLHIAQRSGIGFRAIRMAADVLERHKLIESPRPGNSDF